MHTDAIGLIGQRLSRDPRLAAGVAGQLLALHASGAYAAWAGSCNEAEPFELRDGVGCDVGLLRHVGLVDGRNLLAKVNAFAGRVFVTDGVWIDPRHRVFPYCAESEALVRHVREAGSRGWADWSQGCTAAHLGWRVLRRRLAACQLQLDRAVRTTNTPVLRSSMKAKATLTSHSV